MLAYLLFKRLICGEPTIYHTEYESILLGDTVEVVTSKRGPHEYEKENVWALCDSAPHPQFCSPNFPWKVIHVMSPKEATTSKWEDRLICKEILYTDVWQDHELAAAFTHVHGLTDVNRLKSLVEITGPIPRDILVLYTTPDPESVRPDDIDDIAEKIQANRLDGWMFSIDMKLHDLARAMCRKGYLDFEEAVTQLSDSPHSIQMIRPHDGTDICRLSSRFKLYIKTDYLASLLLETTKEMGKGAVDAQIRSMKAGQAGLAL